MTTETDHWQNQAACKGVGPLMFWEQQQPSGLRDLLERRARDLCAGCPVQAPCRAAGIDGVEPAGMWGGLSYAERKPLMGRRPWSHDSAVGPGTATPGEVPFDWDSHVTVDTWMDDRIARVDTRRRVLADVSEIRTANDRRAAVIHDDIVEALEAGVSQRDISEQLGCSVDLIRSVRQAVAEVAS